MALSGICLSLLFHWLLSLCDSVYLHFRPGKHALLQVQEVMKDDNLTFDTIVERLHPVLAKLGLHMPPVQDQEAVASTLRYLKFLSQYTEKDEEDTMKMSANICDAGSAVAVAEGAAAATEDEGSDAELAPSVAEPDAEPTLAVASGSGDLAPRKRSRKEVDVSASPSDESEDKDRARGSAGHADSAKDGHQGVDLKEAPPPTKKARKKRPAVAIGRKKKSVLLRDPSL